MVFDRGSISDFDRWAELGNEGWDWDGLFPYLKKVSKPLMGTQGSMSDGSVSDLKKIIK